MLSRFIANFLGEQLRLDQDTRDVLVFGAQNLFLNLAGLAAIFLVAWLLQCLPETLILTTVIILTRSFAGGAHLSSALKCNVFTALTFPILAIAAKSLAEFGFTILFCVFATLICLAAVSYLAPVDNPAKPIRNKSHRRRLKRGAVAIVVFIAAIEAVVLLFYPNLYAPAAAAGMGLFWQSFVIAKPGHSLLQFIDRLFVLKTN